MIHFAKQLLFLAMIICYAAMTIVPLVYWIYNPHLTSMQIFKEFWLLISLCLICGSLAYFVFSKLP